MKISAAAIDLVDRGDGGGPLQTSNSEVNRNQKTRDALTADSKLGKRKRKAYLRGGTRDQPILIDDDPIDPQEWSTCDQGPASKKTRIGKTIQDSQRPQAIHGRTGDSSQSRWMPPTPSSKASSLNTPRLSLQRLGAYNDILTDTLIDDICYKGILRKYCDTYCSTSGDQQSVISILRDVVIRERDLPGAESRLLELPSLKRFSESLNSAVEKDDFRRHMRRYLSIYLPDCPFEISGTNRYAMKTHEATIIARKTIKTGEEIKYLSGIRAISTEEEVTELIRKGRGFSIVESNRNQTTSYLFGPAGLPNHDCKPNARLTSTGTTGAKIIAIRDIEIGEEITVGYSVKYFGEDNCECLCKTCEVSCRNGWISEDRIGFHRSPEASLRYESQQERHEKLDDLLSTPAGSSNRSPSNCTGGPSRHLTSGSDVEPVAWAHLDRCFGFAPDQVSTHSCSICENHRKLYGYKWPKTKRKSRRDNEERVYSLIS